MAGGGRGRASLNLHRLQDPNARDVLKVIWDQIDMLQGMTTAPVYRGDVNAAGYAMQNLADATNPQDAVTLKQLQAATNVQHISRQLSASGTAPLNVTNLIGNGGTVTIGSHQQRLATPATPGAWFYEGIGDHATNWLYTGSPDSTWVYVAGIYLSSAADLPSPSTMTANDIGATFLQQDYAEGNALWWWNGNKWDGVGTLRGTLSAIPTADTRFNGMYYEATDFNRVYICTGAAWVDAPGQPTRHQIGLFDSAPGTGWALCDGSNATFSTSPAGTAVAATPNITGLSNYLVGGDRKSTV